MPFTQDIILTVIDKFAIGLLILIAGFFLNKILERFKGEQALRKQYEALRDQTKLNHIQRQIEELYSPLLGLITTSKIVNDIANLKQDSVGTDGTNEEAETKRYFVEQYYLPFNRQMADLIRAKVYLVPTSELPDSFNLFLKHQAQFDCLHSLWRDEGISSDKIPIERWPDQFRVDVQTTLTELRSNYNEYLERVEKTS